MRPNLGPSCSSNASEFQSPIWWGWECDQVARRYYALARAVSIPDLVGLGMRPFGKNDRRWKFYKFQSPIWWGWECDGKWVLNVLGRSAIVSIPDLVGLGMRPDLRKHRIHYHSKVSIPDLVGLGMRPPDKNDKPNRPDARFNPRFGGVGNATSWMRRGGFSAARFNPRFGGVGNATTAGEIQPGKHRCVSIPDLVGLGMRPRLIAPPQKVAIEAAFQSPIWWGWECDIKGPFRIPAKSSVSIPDLVGLGMRRDGPQDRRSPSREFQSPIWWGWECDTRELERQTNGKEIVSIPDLVGLGMRRGQHELRLRPPRRVSIPDLVGLGMRHLADNAHIRRYRRSFNPRFGGVGNATSKATTTSHRQSRVSIPDLVGLGMRHPDYRRIMPKDAAVSIPDLVGLGMRPEGELELAEFLRTFQSPIWWGWECDQRRWQQLNHARILVSIPDLVGLGMRRGGGMIAESFRLGVSIPDLVGLGMRPDLRRADLRRAGLSFNPRFGGVGNATSRCSGRHRARGHGFNPRFGGVGNATTRRIS